MPSQCTMVCLNTNIKNMLPFLGFEFNIYIYICVWIWSLRRTSPMTRPQGKTLSFSIELVVLYVKVVFWDGLSKDKSLSSWWSYTICFMMFIDFLCSIQFGVIMAMIFLKWCKFTNQKWVGWKPLPFSNGAFRQYPKLFERLVDRTHSRRRFGNSDELSLQVNMAIQKSNSFDSPTILLYLSWYSFVGKIRKKDMLSVMSVMSVMSLCFSMLFGVGVSCHHHPLWGSRLETCPGPLQLHGRDWGLATWFFQAPNFRTQFSKIQGPAPRFKGFAEKDLEILEDVSIPQVPQVTSHSSCVHSTAEDCFMIFYDFLMDMFALISRRAKCWPICQAWHSNTPFRWATRCVCPCNSTSGDKGSRSGISESFPKAQS